MLTTMKVTAKRITRMYNWMAVPLGLAVLVALLVAEASFVAEALAAEEEAVNPYGKVLVGDDVTVEMATFEKKNEADLHDVLLRITGAPAHEAGIDGKVLRYRTQHGGTGVDFKYAQGKDLWNRMSSRSPWGNWENFEVYLGGKTYRVYVDPEKSKKLNATAMLKMYQAEGSSSSTLKKPARD